MIALKELFKGYIISDIPHEHQINLEDLLKKVNIIRTAYNSPMNPTNGYRSREHHLRIYSQKMGKDFDINKVPMKSLHLIGKAVDIADPDGKLQKWILSNISALEQAELWCEDFSYTKGWVHFQSAPVKSGKRFFIP